MNSAEEVKYCRKVTAKWIDILKAAELCRLTKKKKKTYSCFRLSHSEAVVI